MQTIATPVQETTGKAVGAIALATVCDGRLGKSLALIREQKRVEIDRQESERLKAFLKEMADRD